MARKKQNQIDVKTRMKMVLGNLEELLKFNEAFVKDALPGLTVYYMINFPYYDNLDLVGTDKCTMNFIVKVYTPRTNHRLSQHMEIMQELHEIFEAKNADYGDSFAQYGLPGILVRLNDKIQRGLTLSAKGHELKVVDEKLEDTLMDLANYAIMGLMLLREGKK